MKVIRKILFCLLIISPLSYAGWPQFSVLNPEQVNNLLEKESCPIGYGRIPPGTRIEIINRYIPKNQKWYWVFSGDGECKKLPEQIHYRDLEPQHTAVYSGGTIATYYGHNSHNLFSFTFTVPAGDCPENSCPWSCGSFTGNPPHEIGCAQDIAGK